MIKKHSVRCGVYATEIPGRLNRFVFGWLMVWLMVVKVCLACDVTSEVDENLLLLPDARLLGFLWSLMAFDSWEGGASSVTEAFVRLYWLRGY